VRRVGYFGSYATDTWGPGSDLDLVAVIDDGPAVAGFAERASAWRIERLPVPADLLVYTQTEWLRLLKGNGAFARMLNTGVVWVYRRVHRGAPGPA
jgi:predicted nucleotidyltransferase